MARTAESGRVVVRHTAGLTHFSRHTHGISHALDIFVDADDPVKFSLLTLGNDSRSRPNAQRLRLQRVGARAAARRPSASRRHRTRRGHRRDPGEKCLQPGMAAPRGVLARERNAVSATGDRCAFIGRNGVAVAAAGDAAGDRSRGYWAAALDPCAALQVRVVLQPGERRRDRVPPRRRRRSRTCRASHRASRTHRRAPTRLLDRVQRSWDGTLDAIHVRTPDDRSSPRQPLAAVSGRELPAVDARRILPARRRVRLSRSTCRM